MDKDIDFDRVEYATNREVENDEGEKTGRVKMFSYDNETFFYELKCPYCQHEFEGEDELGQRPWWIECPECGRSTNVYRIKDKEEKKFKNRGDTPEDVDPDEI
ncbi:MAG: hypothetical protein ABEK01_00575 [Candidatus Nanohaloarchaea archaeon]